jgi:hypothetical protein
VNDIKKTLGATRPLVPEYWVVRVLLHRGTWKPIKVGHLTEPEKLHLKGQCERGELLVIPSDSCIAEPVDVFKAEPREGETIMVTAQRAEANAAELCRKMSRDNPGHEWRVILVMPTGAP